jgi:hypothetical protein
MIRLETADFDDAVMLERLAATAGMPASEFREVFEPLVRERMRVAA